MQARLAIQPIPIVFEPTQVAYGYTVSTFSGTVYHDEGVTPVGAGSGVAMYVNGTATGTVTTNTSGVYSFSNKTIKAHDVVAVYLDGEPENAVLVTKFSAGEISDELITGQDLYKDRLIIRNSTGGLNVTETNLQVAGKMGDDVADIFTATGTVRLQRNAELYVWDSSTYTASGDTFTHDLEINGTFTAGTNDITVSGSLVVPGTINTSSAVKLTSYHSGETLQVNSSALNNLYVDHGLEAYFRMDEGVGLNASGATFNTATGGSLVNGPNWVTTTSGSTLFFNKYALEFDGTDDYVEFGDAFDISDSVQRTFSLWFRRKSSTSEDVLFAKKTGSGTATAGYMLFINGSTDKLNFQVADGTNDYLVISNSTVTDQDWHHVAVQYNPLDINAINVFLDGSIDVGSKAGSLVSGGAISGTFSNDKEFRLGLTSTSSGAFHGILDDLRIYATSMTGTEITQLGSGKKTTGSGTYNLKSNLDINNDFCIYAGTVDVGTGYTINVAGDICAYEGEIRTNSGTVTLDGTTQVVYGSTAFNQLAKTSTVSTTLKFEVHTEQTFSGSLNLQGAVSNRISIDSTRTGSQSYVRVDGSGSTILTFLDVQDSNATGGMLLSCTAGCVDSGNDINWEFLNECGDGITGGTEECDDGDSDNNDVCPNDCKLPVCGDDVVEGLEECEPPGAGSCKSNCLFRTSGGGGGGGGGSAASAGSYFKRPDPPDGCGNRILEPEKGEECDLGKRYNEKGPCSYDCKILYCGDGTVTAHLGEDCEPEVSGTRNGAKQFKVAKCGEVCTPPKVTSTGTLYGGCKTKLLPACGGATSSSPKDTLPAGVCGNGVVDQGEECDFGGICEGGRDNGTVVTGATSVNGCKAGGGRAVSKSGDGCSDKCKVEFCGDGVVQKKGADNQTGTADDEQCDNGSICSDETSKACRLDSDCSANGLCSYNTAKDGSCGENCKLTGKPSAPLQSVQPKAGCGDGIIQDGEQCDAGKGNSDILPDACRKNCQLAGCGDFVIDTEEQCDSGSGNSDTKPDACRTDCTSPVCGDSVVDFNEQCDGSLSCQPDCIFATAFGRCGNEIVERGEQCDDGNTLSGDGCTRYCQHEVALFIPPVCGNSVTEKGEQCDDGNIYSGDGCSDRCKTELVVQTGLVLDADIVIVNPIKIAVALKFIPGSNPCSILVLEGADAQAESIRTAAKKQKIPIVLNITLARSIYNAYESGDIISDNLCHQINVLKSEKPSAPEEEIGPIEIQFGEVQEIPEDPVLTATMATDTVQHAPVGDTGPATVIFLGSGIAGGLAWMRRRKMLY